MSKMFTCYVSANSNTTLCIDNSVLTKLLKIVLGMCKFVIG